MTDDRWTDELGFTDLATDEREETVKKVKELIQNLPEKYPDIFDDADISSQDYQRELRDAVFSLGGAYRQGHGADNEDLVQAVFLEPAASAGLLEFTDQKDDERIDFKGRLDNGTPWAMDVKGGEGQSIGHLLVPNNTEFLTIWSERNATNTKSPPSRLNEVINRIVRWGFNHDEDVAMMIIRDPPAGARTDDGDVIPDIVVFPQSFPTPTNPNPPMRDLDELRFAEVLYETLIGEDDLTSEVVQKHIWFHDLEIVGGADGHRVKKSIYNAYDNSIRLSTRSIDYSRISDV
ncbi:hypothetical protein [Haloarcula rara]|uniref:hypothetical protein n=2 Tax=Haloarcula TaxID=2237 RepID=UPI0023E810BF|nr:hypothetical protein [Halomicroarcula sp. SHR3]